MLHQIGVGALGPVFRTYEPNRDRLVAVKVFRLDVTPEQAAALAEELGRAANAGLFHSSIVEPVAAGVEGTVAYRAEEYVAAESLDVAMRHYAPATIDKALPFITQLASAIDFAREAGVGHGALHPRDIFVTPDEARATGFGVVDALERVGQRAPVRRPYSPPERIAGQSWGTSADVFSLAAIAFELLTGRRPSGLGENMGSLSGAALGDHADEIRAVLARGMNEKPAERYATARAFSAALARAAAVEETTPSLADRTIVAAPAAIAADPDLRIASDLSAPAGTALPDLSLAASLTTTPAASDLLIKDAAASAVGSPEAAGDGLDDFGGEPDSASPAESPRELARKMIAAREVRKRQVRKKPERPLNDLASEPPASDVLIAESKPDAEPDIKPEIGAGIGVTNVPDAEVASAVEAPAKVEQAATAVPVIAAGGLFDRSESEPALPAASDTPRLREVRPAAVSSEDVPDVVPALPVSVAELTPAATLEPTEVIPPPRDYSDRVIAVDEFRARESSSSKPDRAWARIPDRPLNERPALDREPAVQRLKDEDFDSAILPPPAYEEASDGQRPLVLQGALLASLCLMLGFGLGYVYRDRVAATAGQTAAVATAPLGTAPDDQRAPTTGKNPAQGTDVDVTPPPVAVGSATPAAAPAPAASSPRPAPAVAAPKVVPRTGRVVVTSNPAKAAVIVNGKWSGRTPLTLDDVKFGKYVVRVVQPGYEVMREQFVLSPSAASKNVEATLRRSPGASRSSAAAAAPAAAAPKAAASQTKSAAPGSKAAGSGTGIMVIDSRPQGARVFIDGKDLGFTPLRLTAQPVGARAVRLELANHHPWTNTAKVTAGEPTHVTGSLEPIR